MSYVVELVTDNYLTIVIFVVTAYLYRQYQIRKYLPPGPRPWPLLGNLELFRKDKRTLFRELHKKYGDLVSLTLGTRNLLLVNGPEMIHEVFVNHGKDFDKRPPIFSVLQIGQGKGVVNSSGEVWREHRAFLVSNMKELGIGKTSFETHVIEEVDALLQTLRASEGKDFDPGFCIATALCNIVCSISFGKRFDYDDPDFKDILNIFEANMKAFGSTALVNYFPFLEKLPGDLFKCEESLKNVANIQVFLSTWIQRHKETLDPSEPRDFIDRYLLDMNEKIENGESTTMNDSQLLKFVGDLFVGGTETSSTTIRWSFIFLARHPQVQEKVYKEILATLGDSRQRLSVLDKKSMPYTSATILECQRLADIAPFSLAHSNSRPVALSFSDDEDQFITSKYGSSYVIPAGTVVIPNLNSSHHSEKVWGDPMVFRPERFLDNKGRVVFRSELMPFSVGPRVCPGKGLAKMEIFHILTSVMQEFQIRPEESGELPSMEGHIGITYVPNKHKLRVISRKPM